MKRATIAELIAMLFVIIFLYTGISKWLDYYVFRETLSAAPLIQPISKFLAIAVPGTEILASVLLFLPKTRLLGLFTSLLLVTIFTGYIVYILAANDKLPCSCGGVLQQLSWTQHLFFNFTLMILASTAIKLSQADHLQFTTKKQVINPKAVS